MLLSELRAKIEKMDKEKVSQALNVVKPLDVGKHIGEKGTYLAESILFDKKKTLIISPMACGKTTFSFTDLYDLTRECFAQFIFVSPKVSLIQAMESKYKCNTCYGGQGITVNGLPVLTTPDSLYKVILSCEEKDKPFIVVVDEVHECELNYLHRNKLWRPFEAFESDLCCGLVGLTATPDNILQSIKWDSVIQVNPEIKFMQTPSTSIIKNLGSDIESIATHILKTYKTQQKPTVVRINDKNKIKDVKQILEGLNIKVSVWYRDNLEEEDAKLLTEMLGAKRRKFDVLLTTSLVDVGVELYPSEKPIVIDFLDSNSRIIENIQFLGRFREGVDNYHMVVTTKKNDKEFQEYRDILDEMKKKAQNIKSFAESECKEFGLENRLLKTSFNPETETFAFEVDEISVNASAFELYIKQIIADTDRLKRFLENHFTFNSGEIKIAWLPDDYVSVEGLTPLVEELKSDRKIVKEQKEEAMFGLVEFVASLNERDFNLFTTKPDDILTPDKWRIESFGEHYEFYWSEELKAERKKYYTLLRYSSLGTYTNKDLWLKAFNKKWYKQFKGKCQVVNSNFMYNNKAPVYQIDESIDRMKITVYDIRNLVQATKGKEVGVKLSDKYLTELLERLTQKKKCYSKWKLTRLKKYMELIYNISSDKYHTITSARTKLTLEH